MARSRNSCTASEVVAGDVIGGRPSGGTVHADSPARRNRSRDVATMRTLGAPARSAAAKLAAPSMTCSQLSSTTSAVLSARAAITCPDGSPGNSEMFADVGDDVSHGRVVADRREFAEPHAVGKVVEALGGGFEREAGLARAAGADQRDEPRSALIERADVRELVEPADERRLSRRKVGRRAVEAEQRREVGRQPVTGELEDVLGCREILEAVHPDADQAEPV